MASPEDGPHCGCIGDAELARIDDAWASLPSGMKQAILDIVDAAKPNRKTG
ncbi:MAG: hypothetical protein QM703_15800 [Gemmatales bacterium]